MAYQMDSEEINDVNDVDDLIFADTPYEPSGK